MTLPFQGVKLLFFFSSFLFLFPSCLVLRAVDFWGHNSPILSESWAGSLQHLLGGLPGLNGDWPSLSDAITPQCLTEEEPICEEELYLLLKYFCESGKRRG